MASEDSDDEPLSVLAAAKKLNPEKFVENVSEVASIEPRKRKRKSLTPKKLGITIKIRKQRTLPPPPIIERPTDVWLYLKDLNPAGPYSCLLCSDWFINRSKMIMHYVLNHKKDFCGICRYFVPDRQAWQAHVKFHIPWPCSQCIANFPTQITLRQHLSSVHNLVHCRLCHFRLPDDEQYHTHLFQKHNVTNVLIKDEEVLWDFDYEGTTKFICLLCSKPNNLSSTFFAHYMGYHHFTIKCLTSLISGRDPPFTVNGADVSAHFIDGQLQGRIRYGYVDLDKTPLEGLNKSSNSSGDALNYLKTEIKQETASDNDESKKDSSKADPNVDPEDPHKDYKGDEDFDVTLTELIVLEKCYFDYVNRTTNDINCNQMPENSCIEYEDDKSGIIMDVDCPLCSSKYENTQAFTMHMNKMHCVKLVPLYTCRVCASTFDNQAELESHVAIELGNFDDLWICQFCDKEFDNREATRRHLTEHWEVMEYDNCFSPHLGFKCRFCPTLFWNENDRESHQVRSHFSKYKDQFYKCESCSEIFSDKVWFIHHHLEKHFANKMTTYLLKCCLCCIVLPNIDEMRSHFLEEHPEARKVYCSLDMCQYKPLSHRKSFKLHVKTIHNPSTRAEKAVSCAVCGREFASSRACGAHMAQVHGPGKFKCKLCRDVLHTLDERKLHYLLRHPGRHPYECADCGKSFQYKSSLYMHRQDHAPNKQSFTCSYCGKVFMKKDSFREHVQIHEGPRHACSYCPMRFVQRSNMLRHERRHTGERPYACPHCPRTFADKGACNSHVRTHSKETSFACLYCGQTFVQKSKLTYHIRKHTGENLETCPVCSKLFTSGCALREHMKIHIAKKELVKCPLCDRKYQDERYMLRHLRTTHTGAHHTCPLCHKLLTSAPGLRHHVLTHSAVNLFHCKCCQKSYAIKRTMIKHLRKRHGLKGTEINIKDFFKKLDPRECQLGLDEETMTSIFGPPKKVMTDILIGDYVTFANNFNNSQSNDQDDGENTEEDSREDAREDEQSAEEDYKYYNENRDDTGDGKREVEIENVSIKQEAIATEVELEPTDFVSVKIEPYDENESN